MKIDIRLEEHDGPESRDKIAALYAAVYPPDVLATVVWRNVTSAGAELRIVAVNENNNPVAAVGLVFRDGLVDDRPVRMGGIGGVMTAPALQKRGLGRAVMLRAQEVFMREKSVSFGLLFCEPKNIAFYEKLDWHVFAGSVIAEQPNAIGPYTLMTPMIHAFHGTAPQGGTINLCGLPW